ncbi:hypothetical protein PF008_g26004 [Phytophthora fragariae]|uniref:Uncharacterized protein n=1 Tax=Phytophthora fragariae TaxID=53985 RepID=A0A6G0QJ86_9STRA|nr:hypothetical protein PF008_g26004 [Phytophthora fragariae]
MHTGRETYAVGSLECCAAALLLVKTVVVFAGTNAFSSNLDAASSLSTV